MVDCTYSNLFKVFYPGHWVIVNENLAFGTPTVDFYRRIRKNGVYVLSDTESNTKWPGCYLKKSELLPLREYSYEGIKVMGANDPV